VRAGRLLNLLLVLQNGGRFTARDLAGRLGVSERTVLRDIEVLSGSGVPVYGVRGPGGGFEMLDTFEQAVPPLPPGLTPGTGRLRRVRVRIAPAALQLALVTGRPERWRARPDAQPPPDRADWLEGSFRFDSYDAAVRELVALGPEVEVLLPAELRRTMAAIGRRIARLHRAVRDTDASPPHADRQG
jgi:predicted DNA-binding transcriptional regulator YafY